MSDRPMTGSRRAARVLLVAFEDQDNLGVRYLASFLRKHGHEATIVAFGNAAPVIEAAARIDPDIIGFSLIFQYMVPEFREAIAELRAAGTRAHVTVGGHYASFEPGALLTAIPDLDSVVRFEGEETLLELAETIVTGGDWHSIAGLAFRGDDGGAVLTASRQGTRTLDDYPWPDRDDIRYEEQEMPTASILGSRGCPWQCSFCSIITFYEGNGTKGRRRRNPIDVVDEMEHLHRDRGVEVLLWQDDDFLGGGRDAVRWAHTVAAESIRRGLHHSLRWKISCRSDEAKRASLEPLVEAGLTHVYLGVESGDADDLRDLNKRLLPDVHLRAGEALRDLGLSFDFGFMLLQPWSTVTSVRNNIHFLRAFAGDGYTGATFCRMLPYVGTAAEKRLRDEDRLFEHDLRADYLFLDPRLDTFYSWMLQTFACRNFDTGNTLGWLCSLTFESCIDLPHRPASRAFRKAVQAATAANNRTAFDILESGLDYVERAVEPSPGDDFLQMLKAIYHDHDSRTRADIEALKEMAPPASVAAARSTDKLVCAAV